VRRHLDQVVVSRPGVNCPGGGGGIPRRRDSGLMLETPRPTGYSTEYENRNRISFTNTRSR
jgi:hypothetical protein